MVAVEESPFLFPVHGVVRGIEVEHDLGGRLLVRREERIHEKLSDRRPIPVELVITVAFDLLPRAQLKAVERALPRQGSRFLLAGADQVEQRIVTPLVVIVEVLVAKADPEYPLRQQLRHAEARLAALSTILAACRHARNESAPSLDLLKKDQSAVARGDFAVMPNDDPFVARTL